MWSICRGNKEITYLGRDENARDQVVGSKSGTTYGALANERHPVPGDRNSVPEPMQGHHDSLHVLSSVDAVTRIQALRQLRYFSDSIAMVLAVKLQQVR